jgi:hypothetical protein
MRKISFLGAVLALTFTTAACGDDDDAPPPMPMVDLGPADAGPPDLGRDMNVPPPRDMGSVDVCAAADAEEALASFDCNGDPPGRAATNALFGTCTPDADPEMNPAGSCADPSNFCLALADSGSPAFCVSACEGAASELYAQTGDCPTGSRCLTVFSMDGASGFCVPSCATDDECASNYCDPTDGSCYFDADLPPPAPDAGMPDAGTPDTDAGTPDTDAGTPDSDAGTPDTDAGTPDTDAGTPASDAGTPDTDGAVVADPDGGPPPV